MPSLCSSETEQKTELPAPAPEELAYRNMFFNAIVPELMGLAGFEVTRPEGGGKFIGYSDPERQKKFVAGELGAPGQEEQPAGPPDAGFRSGGAAPGSTWAKRAGG